jgi:excisionase family DNA binding protein
MDMPTAPSVTSGLLDYEQAAPFLGCTPRMVRKLVELRQLESVKVGRLVRIEPAAIDRYIEAHRRPAIGTQS